MFLKQVEDVIRLLDVQFDAHDFILKFIKEYTHSYFQLLGRFNGDVRQTDAYIGSFLQKNADILAISETGKVISMNVMSNQTNCMSWRKL